MKAQFLTCLLLFLNLTSIARSQVDVAKVPALQSVAFSSQGEVWCVTDDGLVLSTGAQGEKWTQAFSDKTVKARLVSVVGTKLAWTIDDHAQIWRRADKGDAWAITARLSSGLGSPFLIEQLTFVDPLHGWMVDPFSIWRTEDGGVNWKRHRIEKAQPQTAGHRCFFLNKKIGWLFLGQEGVIYRTDDGGQMWKEQRITSLPMVIAGLFFVDNNTGWVCGFPNGAVFFTDDGGTTWRRSKIPSEVRELYSIHFIDKREGWALGGARTGVGDEISSIILHSKDGGKTWTHRLLPFSQQGDRIFFSGKSSGWISTANSIYRTANGGGSWRQVLNVSRR